MNRSKMYPCKRCGACCCLVGNNPWGKKMARPSGVCKWLDEQTNLCKIYAKRPLICRVDQYYEQFLSDEISREEFYQLNLEQCKLIQKRKE